MRMRKSTLWFAVTAFLSILADLGTKAWIESAVEPYSRKVVVEGLFVLTNVRNPGVAFGLFSQGGLGKILFFGAVGLLALGFILWLVKRIPAHKVLEPFLLGLIFGGAAGNLVDRVRYGEVVDFIDVFWRDYHWYTFNVADAGITVGVLGIMLMEIFRKKAEEQG